MAYRWNGEFPGNASEHEPIHLYTVSEVCSLLDITRKTLFYYDRIGLAAPTARLGPQAHKVYDSAALEVLRRIAEYRDAGLTIEEIRILRDSGSTERNTVFRAAKERLEEERKTLEKKQANLEKLIENGKAL